MPLTPFHLGPGLLAKSVAPRWFSFRAFALSQVVIDCETAWNIYKGHQRLHTFFHSYLGVTVAMTISALMLVFYNVARSRLSAHIYKLSLDLETQNWIRPFELRGSFVAIVLGGWSHVFLDSIMHLDVQPLAPLSSSKSAFLNLISIERLHMVCLWSFAGAAVIWGLRTACAIYRRDTLPKRRLKTNGKL